VNLGTWDVTWERCAECPRPVMDGIAHDHARVVSMRAVEESPEMAW
jgi:hypothetical protein